MKPSFTSRIRERSAPLQERFGSGGLCVPGLKTFLCLCVLVFTGLSSQSSTAFVYENAFELQSSGDFDGNGQSDLVIVDKVTGSYRIAYQLSPGVYTWVSARASGIANATALGIGKLDSLTFDSLAIAGPDANRINVLDASNTAAASLPANVFIPSLGPSLVGVIDIGGGGNTLNDDLYVASIYNGLLPYRETLLRNNGTTNRTILADNSLSYKRERANAILINTNSYPRLALFDRNALAGQDAFDLLDLSSGASVMAASLLITNLPEAYDYVTAQFVSTNPLTEIVFYATNSYFFYEYQITQPVPGTYNLAYANTYGLTNAIDRIFTLPGTNGTRLLVLYSNDLSAAVFKFDGLNPPSLAQAFNADPGQHFTGAGALGNSGFMAYSAPAGESISQNFRQWMWTGSAYSNTASGSLPRVSPYSASGNVMQFAHEPFVTNNPILLRLNNAGDWSQSPSFSGSPGNISVTTLTFLNSTSGLVNPASAALGAAHPLAQFGLANQFSNMISVFSFTPPAGDKVSDVTISPVSGTYAKTFSLQFTAANPSDNIYYRLGAGAWNSWSNASVVWIFTNIVVQYYSQPTNIGNAKSLVKSAGYQFTAGPSTLDSNGDGVPDFVKIAKGLNPNAAPNSDGSGYSDLDELIYGSGVSSHTRLNDEGQFNLFTTPIPWDGFSNAPSLCQTGTVLYAYDLQGSLLSRGVLSNVPPAVVLSNITIVLNDQIIAEASDLHYNILTTNIDTKVGREMVGLMPVLAPQFPVVNYTFGSAGGNLLTEATNWIQAASNALINLPFPVLTNTLTIKNTLEALLFEQAVANLMIARGIPASNNITLFPFRPSDAGRTNPPQALLLSLETATNSQPGYQLPTVLAGISNLVENSADPNIAALRAVVQDIYRTDSLLNNSNPAVFISPVDEIRLFLWTGNEDTNYLAYSLTSSEFNAASNGVQTILASLSPRPTTNVLLVIRPDTLSGNCPILDVNGGGGTFALVDVNDQPFAFPGNFQMLPGTIVQVTGFTDVTNSICGYPAIQVTSAMLYSVPVTSDADTDGDLLIDTWEDRFFGHTGVNPFADNTGDGYSNLQKMLEGSDPLDYYSIPAVPPVTFSRPTLMIGNHSGLIEIDFTWPARYISDFNFGVLNTPDLSQPFTSLPASAPVQISGDQFKITFTLPSGTQHYYYETISLAVP
jgi:hypothetical protein